VARRIEEEESYWPGFVDALSTIVMVVTFLLIILGVAIFAISTQVSKAISDNNAATAQAKSDVEATKQALQQTQTAKQSSDSANAAAEATAAQIAQMQQSGQTETARLTKQLEQTQTESEQLAKQLMAASETVTTQAQQIDQQQQAAVELKKQSVASQAAMTETAAKAQEAAAELEKTKEALKAKQDEAANLARSVAELSQAATATPTQDTEVKADNTMRVSSTTVPIDPTEINVASPEVDAKTAAVEVTSAQEVLTVRFQKDAIDLNAEAAVQAQAFVQQNSAVLKQHKISIWSFYDEATLSVTQAKRTAYFRLLAVRNILLTEGFDPASLEISVRAAEQAADIDSVQTFLQ
jgi:DNA repair exonuclease SbcCD ATPase subunit